jgi:hypothetical protein
VKLKNVHQVCNIVELESKMRVQKVEIKGVLRGKVKEQKEAGERGKYLVLIASKMQEVDFPPP